jgi:hypothetical protein
MARQSKTELYTPSAVTYGTRWGPLTTKSIGPYRPYWASRSR